MTIEQLYQLILSIKVTLDKLTDVNQRDSVNEELRLILTKIGPIDCTVIQNHTILEQVYDIWHRLFRPYQLGTRSSLKTVENTTRLLFVENGFFLDIGLHGTCNLLFLAYRILNRSFVVKLLEKVKNTPIYAELINSKYKGMNILNHIWLHLIDRMEDILQACNSGLCILEGTIHKIRQYMRFANELISSITNELNQNELDIYKSILEKLYNSLGAIESYSKNTQANNPNAAVYVSHQRSKNHYQSPSIEHENYYTTISPVVIHAYNEFCHALEVLPTVDSPQSYPHTDRKGFEYPETVFPDNYLPEELYNSLSNQPEEVCEYDDFEEQPNPLLLPPEYRILPPFIENMTPQFKAARMMSPDLSLETLEDTAKAEYQRPFNF